MIRRHLQFILGGPAVEQVESLRRYWDPVMAARAPAHVTLVYPEEHDDERLLLARVRDTASTARPFAVRFGELGCDGGGRGGVWYSVVDRAGSWRALRNAIVAEPFQSLAVAPHITIVHPRTSSRGPEAWAALAGSQLDEEVVLSEIVHTETDESGLRVLGRFPLLGRAVNAR